MKRRNEMDIKQKMNMQKEVLRAVRGATVKEAKEILKDASKAIEETVFITAPEEDEDEY